MNTMAVGFTSDYASVLDWIGRKMFEREFSLVRNTECSTWKRELTFVSDHDFSIEWKVEMNRKSFNRWSVIL